MQDLKVTLIQSQLHWQQPEANRAMFEEKIWEIKQTTDIIVLPEMFSTGFSMDAANLAEPMGTHTFRWMQQQSEQTGAAIVGSYIVKDQGNFFNRLVWVTPDGNYQHYDKRHLFRMADEHHTYTAGKEILVVTWKGWKICPQICYDLRFPVWNRNVFLEKENSMAYDLLLFVANWPNTRVSAWDTLLQARAIENLAYVVGVNRVGQDGKGIPYNGHSAVVDPKGTVLFFNEDQEVIATLTLIRDELDRLRKKFPVYYDADNFEIER